MENGFMIVAKGAPGGTRRLSLRTLALALALSALGAIQASAQERILFPAIKDANNDALVAIIQKINAEQVRVDVATWFLVEDSIVTALINKFNSGVPVRVIGDRVSVFEQTDLNTRNNFLRLANAHIPIRIREFPRDFPEVMHWKCGIFVGQNTVEFGSGNWTTFELEAFSTTDFKDETAMFTNDPALVNGFLTKFDQMWADTTSFMDFPAAYQLELGTPWTVPMTINRTRLEPDFPTNAPGMGWGQGPEVLNPILGAINNPATTTIDFVTYRLSVATVADALIARSKAGIPVRVFIEPTQYRNIGYPEYWMVGATTDRMWVAGIPIKQRVHAGITHMKTIITTATTPGAATALVASSNFTAFWQRDHNYFFTLQNKPTLWQAMKDRFNAMWLDTVNYTNFTPLKPEPPALVGPSSNAVLVSTTPTFTWQRAPWAVNFDVYLGTRPETMAVVGRVNAQVTETPPDTYSFTAAQPLLANTTYWWKVVSRTYATDVNASLINPSEIWSFTTGATSGGGGGSGPFSGTPLALPGLLEAENFDLGANGVAYSDTTAGNSGGQYRTTDVDIEGATDTGGGFDVGWLAVGEWLKYTVNVGTAGSYTLDFRVTAASAGGTFHLESNGTNLTGPLTIPGTGGWQSWTTVTKTGVSLSAGTQILRLVFDSAGPGGVVGNINYIRVTAGAGGGGGGTLTPFGGTAVALPGTIQSENFDDGGPGVAYNDTTLGNAGGQWRATDVDIEATADVGGGFDVGWVAPGEWLKYTVNVSAAGTYNLEFRVAAAGAGGTFHLEVNGVDKTGPLTVPNTGSWQSWTSINKTGVSLVAGTQVWRLVIDSPSGIIGNFNYIRVTAPPSGGGSTPFGGTAVTLPGTIQSENFDDGGPGVAYNDTTLGNSGGQYRATDVDIEATTDTGGGFDVGWGFAGDWLKYTVNVSTAGVYNIDVRVASNGAGGTFHIEVNGVDKTGPMTVPTTGGWQTWTTIRKSGVTLSAGVQVWRIVLDTNGPTTAVANFNWIRISP
jgi:phosphatidylserine/phosphatidylglycerophosphate/cardiolipin synthase-like enzyme